MFYASREESIKELVKNEALPDFMEAKQIMQVHQFIFQ